MFAKKKNKKVKKKKNAHRISRPQAEHLHHVPRVRNAPVAGWYVNSKQVAGGGEGGPGCPQTQNRRDVETGE